MKRTNAVAADGSPLKRAKRPRRVTAGIQSFALFPSGVVVDGPFRWSVRTFVSNMSQISSPSASQLRTWRIALRIGDDEDADADLVELDVVEEDVERSRNVYCDHCRVVGWSWIPVCSKRYHFIIRNEGNPASTGHRTCCRCGALWHFSESSHPCNHEMTAVDLEDWAYLQLEDTTHLLHGVVHANGYGHLVRVNGREGGSRILTGCDLMGFWDRLCKLLHVRKVSVMDASKKYGMEYRLLHAVTSSHSWYGDWGYHFGGGSFAITAEAYQNSLDNLSNIPLSLFSGQQHQKLCNMIQLYIWLSDHKLKTVKDLFCFITKLIQQCHDKDKPSMEAKQPSETWPGHHILHAWSEQEVRHAEKLIMKILQAVNGSKWVTWRDLKRATFRSIGAKGLLDYCLKQLEGKSTDEELIVSVRYNDETSSIEYRLETAASNRLSSVQCPKRPQKGHLISNLKFFYNILLNPATMHPYKPQSTWASAQSSAQKLLDCKQFIKHYDDNKGLIASDLPALQMWCNLEIVDHPKNYSVPPELLMLPVTATVADLKHEATKAFQETYLIFQRLQVQQLVNYEAISDATQVHFLLGKIDFCQVRGRCYDSDYLFKRFLTEKGTENWTVECACGAKDDDGERMLACDVCGVWQHTRCSGINDFDDVPSKFMCRLCTQKPKRRRGASRRMYEQSTSSES